MKAAPFHYLAPESVEEAVALLSEHGDEAKLLAGGQSLVPLLALRLATPAVLIDLNRVLQLDHLEDAGHSLKVGALVRHRAIETLDGLGARCPMITEAVSSVGHVSIRNRGTIVGSLAHADPAAEWPAIALALDGEVDVIGPNGVRTIGAKALFETYFTTTIRPDEVATEARFRIPEGRVGSSFVELARRRGDFAIAGAGALLHLNDSGTIQDARIVVIGVGSTALRLEDAERVLIGEQPGNEPFAEASEVVYRSVNPPGDIHGGSGYRRSVTRVLSQRALAAALERASAEGAARG